MFAAMAEVELARNDSVLTITLNRPDVLNALNRVAHEGIQAGLRQAAGDPGIRAVVITGAGRGFCVGQDLEEFRSGADDVAQRLRERYHPVVIGLRELEKPVIAAVNGVAAGAGVSLACACDFRIASTDARLVPAFSGIGLVPDSGATAFLARLLGVERAFAWLVSNRPLHADEALELGLVDELVEPGELAQRVLERAQALAAGPTRALALTKRLLADAPTTPLREQLEREAVAQAEAATTEDFREGVAAFLEKREPRFSGR
jgi:2-(1,2-epoxy-1,2-dihydrophenyl)acetyl-CoA isomerase